MNEVDGLVEALRLQVEVVSQLSKEDLELASGCAGWSVGQVLQHSLGVTQKFTDFAAGRTDHPHTPIGNLLTPDHVSAFDRAAREADVAWRQADMKRTCYLPFGEFSASMAAGINLFDVLAHTWDVGEVTHRRPSCSNELWAVGLQAAQAVVGNSRDPTHYGPELQASAEATLRERFLAYLGRAQSLARDR